MNLVHALRQMHGAIAAALARTLLSVCVCVCAAVSATAAPTPADAVFVNDQLLDAAARQALRGYEAQTGAVPPGRYWYDAATGAAGRWGGPMSALLAPGMALPGPLPAAASGGGDGRLTGVFINGRELHPQDVAGLRQFGSVVPGRYRWDAWGNVSLDGGGFLFNFYALAQSQARAQQGSKSLWRPGAKAGEGTFVGKGCARVSQRKSPTDPDSVVDTYVGCN
jgi:hypothetical protein